MDSKYKVFLKRDSNKEAITVIYASSLEEAYYKAERIKMLNTVNFREIFEVEIIEK